MCSYANNINTYFHLLVCLDEHDFAPIVDVNRFPASTGSSTPRKFCFDIAITTDKIYEDDETFTVFLRQNPLNQLNLGLLVQPNSTEITIMDKDGK